MSKDLAKSFDRHLWITKGARFNAYRRLMRKNYASIFTISILTFYSLVLALVPWNDICPEQEKLIPTISVSVSIFILILSLLEVAKGYEVKAERLHQNAMALNGLYDEFEISEKNSSDLKTFNERYHTLLQGCSENHNPCDSRFFQSEHPHEFKLQWEIQLKKNSFVIYRPTYWWIRFLYFFETYWLYIALSLLPLGFLSFFHFFPSLCDLNNKS